MKIKYLEKSIPYDPIDILFCEEPNDEIVNRVFNSLTEKGKISLLYEILSYPRIYLGKNYKELSRMPYIDNEGEKELCTDEVEIEIK